MSKIGGHAYMRSVGMSDAQIAYFLAKPAWMTAVWAVGVWGALAGSLLLLLRSRLAVAAFLASLIAYVVSLVDAYAISPAPGGGPSMMAIQGVILVGCLFFAWYALTMRRAGVLR
jgi:hypothetical protein